MGYRYTLTQGVLNRLKTQGYNTCDRCKKPFKVGDSVISGTGESIAGAITKTVLRKCFWWFRNNA